MNTPRAGGGTSPPVACAPAGDSQPREPAPPKEMIPAGRYYGVTVWLGRDLPRLSRR